MKRIVYILPNYSMCRVKFNTLIGRCVDFGWSYEVNFSPMRVTINNSVEYSFIHDLDKLRGLRVNQVFMDDLVCLTDEECAFVQSRINGENK